jgi:hypothetical protein
MRLKKRVHGIFKSTLACALVGFTVMAVPELAMSARKVASIREPASVRNASDIRSNGQKPTVNRTLTKENKEALGRAMLAELAHALNKVRSQDDFQRMFASKLSTADQKDLKADLKRMVDAPRAHMDGDSLVVVSGGGVGAGAEAYKISWSSFPEPQFNFKGKNWSVDWHIAPHQTLRWQIDLLLKKIELAQNKSTALNALLWPRANALVDPVTLTLITVALNAVVTLGISYGPTAYCYIMTDKVETKGQVAGCDWYINQRRSSEAETKSVKVDALEKSRSDVIQESTDWLKDGDTKCPSKMDTSKNIYVANVREIDLQGTKVMKVGEGFRVRMMFQADGKPTEGFTAPMGTDMDTEDSSERAMAKFKFDDKGVLKDIQVPNKEAKTDKTAPSYLPIDVTTDDAKLDPEQRARRDQVRSLVKAINKWMQQCMDQDMTKQVKEKQERTGGKTPESSTPSSTTPTGTVH